MKKRLLLIMAVLAILPTFVFCSAIWFPLWLITGENSMVLLDRLLEYLDGGKRSSTFEVPMPPIKITKEVIGGPKITVPPSRKTI